MKKFSGILVAGMLCCPAFAQAVQVTLKSSDVEEAKQFGVATKNRIEEVLDRRYGLGAGGPLGHDMVVRTKWCKLALLAGVKAQQRADLTEQEQQLILEDPMLQIDIRLSGNSLDFAQDYRVLLRQKDREIKPEKIHADHFQTASRTSRIPSGFPQYAATIRAYFKYDQLDPGASGTLMLKKDSVEKNYTLDLGAFK